MLLKNVQSKKEAAYVFPTILVVEDDKATADVLQQFFHMTGYICQIRYAAFEILNLVRQLHPDIIILDYLLPQRSGMDLCTEIKRDQSTAHIPVILYSAYPSVSPYSNFGPDLFISKPFDLDEILKHVEWLLERSSLMLHPSGNRMHHNFN